MLTLDGSPDPASAEQSVTEGKRGDPQISSAGAAFAALADPMDIDSPRESNDGNDDDASYVGEYIVSRCERAKTCK